MLNLFVRAENRLYREKKRKQLKNATPTILANNCVAGIIYHDLGLRFTSPTVNIGIRPKEYIRFLSNLEHYMSQPLVQIEDYEDRYPQALCDDIRIILAHMESFDAAVKKWNERKQRVDYDNLFVVMTDQLDCTREDMEAFDKLPFKHKVLLTHLPQPGIQCAYYIPGYEEEKELPVLTDPKPGFFKRRYLDDFDYVRFLNGEMNL